MTSLDSSRPIRRAALDFAEARINAEQAEVVQQHAAARRVAERAIDASDCRELLSMLGLSGRPMQGARE